MPDYYSPEEEFASLARMQSGQALGYGDIAAGYADPFAGERANYQKRLRNLIADPGSITSSPFYQFALEQGMDAINRRAAARGQRNSGNVLAELARFGTGLASQAYFPQADLLSRLAMSGSSPAAAGLSFARAGERSQDYANIAAAARAKGQSGASQIPWWMRTDLNQMPTTGSQSAVWSSSGGAGGYQPFDDYLYKVGATGTGTGLPYSGSPSYDNWDIGTMGDLSAYGLSGYSGGGIEPITDNWDLMGDLGNYGLGGSNSLYGMLATTDYLPTTFDYDWGDYS